MVAFDAAPGAMKLSILDLPPFPPTLAFDVIDTEDDGDGLRVLTMREFCLETWKLAGDGTAWTLKDTSVRFYRVLASMFGERKLQRRRHEFEIVGVVDGFVFFRQSGILLPIDLKTMKLTRLSDHDCSPATIYPYTKTRAWPPSFLNPTE
ncbi:hypothetical protein E2562_017221 [Oryza meyeriana var. granulata]|uniref:DUF1618 domain-containing protein n=1 Tax=Oryza meyeriana var. granulata TaxID=110450 RepID=A0A6G1ELU3_9ORYZ|nr:hypothetical protein E2562_017221 [Oryza meyeriana var. granulata]